MKYKHNFVVAQLDTGFTVTVNRVASGSVPVAAQQPAFGSPASPPSPQPAQVPASPSFEHHAFTGIDEVFAFIDTTIAAN